MDYLQKTLIIINPIITIVGLIFVHLRFKKIWKTLKSNLNEILEIV